MSTPSLDAQIKTAKGKRLTRNLLPWTEQFNGYLRNPDKIPLSTYNNMADTDETIQSGLDFISLSARAMLDQYTHPDEDIQKFIRSQITNMTEGWWNFWDELITDGLTFGFANAEICMSVETDQESGKMSTKLDSLIGVNPMSGSPMVDLELGSRTYGDLAGFVQWPNSGYQRPIPAGKLVSWAYRSKHSNPFGRSLLKSVWKWWAIKDQMAKAWAVTMERTGSPLTWISTPDGEKPTELEDGSIVERAQYLLSIMEDLQNTTGLVVEGDEKIGFMQVARSVGNDFKVIVDHCDMRIYTGMLIPILMFNTSEVGSNALAKIHFQVYIMAMARLMQSLIPIVIRSVIRLLIVANFGQQKQGYGTFEVRELSEENLKLLSDIFYAMTQEGYISPKLKSDMDMVRSKLSLTPITDEDHKQVVKWAEEAAAPPPATGIDPSNPAAAKPGQKKSKAPAGRKNNPAGAKPDDSSVLPTPKAPAKKHGRPKA